MMYAIKVILYAVYKFILLCITKLNSMEWRVMMIIGCICVLCMTNDKLIQNMILIPHYLHWFVLDQHGFLSKEIEKCLQEYEG